MSGSEIRLGEVDASRQPGASARSMALHGLVAALMFVSPLVVFVPAAILASGLRNGRRGLWASTAAAAALLTLLGVTAGTPAALTPVPRMIFEIGIPSAIGLEMILRGLLLGPVLLATVAASFGGFALVEVVMRAIASYSPYEAIVSNFRAASAASAEAYRSAGFPAEAIATMERIADAIAGTYMPALLATTTILIFALSFAMLPRLKSGRVLVPAFLFRFLAWPETVLFAFVLGGLAPLTSGMMRTAGFSLLIVIGVLYLLQGLAVFRFHQVRLGLGILGTLLAILTLILLTPYGVTPAVLFLVGLFDPFFDFRKLKRKETPDESHSD